jgi:signal transduction histidine kinase
VGTIEIYYASDGQDVIKRDGSAAEMLKQIRKDIQSDFVKGLCCVLSEVLDNTKRRARESKDNTEELNILSSVRSRKLDFIKTHYSRQQDFDKNTFVEDYHKYFGPLDKVFSNLLMQFGLRVAIYFSYRLPSDDHLSYFFTTEQVETLLSKRRLSIEDFEHLWTYPYQRGGLNGYIMNTKNPIYLPNMHLDDRWTLLMKEPDRTDTITKYDSKRQKQLLLKMFDLSEAPLHTYIVPILVAYNCGKEPALLVAMHCTTADPIPHDLRKHMFDLAWEASAGVETALLAQWASEKRFESETEKLILRALLAAGVGHDLRGPLQDIKNELVFLKKQVHPKTPEIENSLSNAERQLYFSLKVAWDILDYYVGKDLKEKLVIKEVALRNVIENSLSHLRIAGDIKIVKNIDPTLKVQLDSDRMARVFINLVNNACNSFEGMQGSQKEIKFVGEDLGERICIEIADTGSGIEKEDIHKIFLPNVSKKNEKGIGIGLLIVQAIIKAHQGNITVDSEVGKGTTVKICLPKKQGKEGVKCKVIQE